MKNMIGLIPNIMKMSSKTITVRIPVSLHLTIASFKSSTNVGNNIKYFQKIFVPHNNTFCPQVNLF